LRFPLRVRMGNECATERKRGNFSPLERERRKPSSCQMDVRGEVKMFPTGAGKIGER